MAEVEPPIWKAEYAKSGRSKCKRSKQLIPKGQCRVGKEFTLQGHRTTYWYLIECIPKPRKGKLTTSDIQGFSELEKKDQDKIKAQLENTESTKSKKRKSTSTSKATGGGRASKKVCRLPAGWESKKVSELKAFLRERNLKLGGKRDEVVDRLRGWENKLLSMDKNLAKEERKKFMEYEEEFNTMSVNNLKKLLKANGQKISGKKMELVERCADAKLYGCLPKCEECGGGRLQVNYPFPFGHKGQGDWFCKGYYDDGEFMPCYFRSSEPQERTPWDAEDDSD